MSFIDQQMEAERETFTPRWAEFWRNYTPIPWPTPPRRPTPSEIKKYLASKPSCPCPTPCETCR